MTAPTPTQTREPYVSADGDVYTTDHILHRVVSECSHRAFNFCASCDTEGAMSAQYGDLCPWEEHA